MMRLILINTQEWLRLKFLHIVVFLSLLYFFVSYLLGSLSFIEQQRMIFDFGLAGLELSTMFIAAFISTHALYRDIERKTILVLLARPIPRWNLLIGYLGSLALLNSIVVFILGGVLFSFLEKSSYSPALFISIFTILIKSIVISSFGILCSVLARAMFSLVITISYWMLAYSLPDLEFFARKLGHEGFIYFTDLLNFIVPNFYSFNWKNYHFIRSELVLNDIAWAWLHCAGWVMLCLFLATLGFKRKEIV